VAPKQGRPLLVALGDSITAGVGGKWNRGYPWHLHRMLAGDAPDLKLVNWGIPGLTVPRLKNALRRGEHLHPNIAQARWIVMTIGGNDLINLMPKKDSQEVRLLSPAETKKFARDMDELILTLRSLTAAPIFLGDLYNPFPHSELSAGLIGTVNRSYFQPLAARYRTLHLVTVSSCLRGQEEATIQYYNSGTVRDLKKFWRRPIHPNDLGHEKLAEAFFQSIRAHSP
jgi:lysophospholipase L1-like esterase